MCVCVCACWWNIWNWNWNWNWKYMFSVLAASSNWSLRLQQRHTWLNTQFIAQVKYKTKKQSHTDRLREKCNFNWQPTSRPTNRPIKWKMQFFSRKNQITHQHFPFWKSEITISRMVNLIQIGLATVNWPLKRVNMHRSVIDAHKSTRLNWAYTVEVANAKSKSKSNKQMKRKKPDIVVGRPQNS